MSEFQKLKYFTKYSQNLKTYQYLDQHPTYSTKMKEINKKNIDIGILTSYHTTDKCIYNTSKPHFTIKGSYSTKKTVKKGDIVPFWRPHPPKRGKRGHLLFDYRQKCVNGTRDILMLKARKMTILAIIMF